jgi:hypothetical protein
VSTTQATEHPPISSVIEYRDRGREYATS